MKKLKKYLLIVIIGIFTMLGGSYFYVEFAGYFKFSKEWQLGVVNRIRNSPELPERFYVLYEKIYPGYFTDPLFSYYIRKLAFPYKREIQSPYRDMALMTNPVGFDLTLVSFHLTHLVSSKECFNCRMHYYEFLNNTTGVYEVSRKYFNKEIDELDDREMIEIIVYTFNPSFYNKFRFPDRVEQKVEMLMSKLQI
ncbi:MAG: transglycosylase domain-containing protein [Bacteroides sp.]|nr:transglycosylase domain-containing protein [Bacteroides sp.]